MKEEQNKLSKGLIASENVWTMINANKTLLDNFISNRLQATGKNTTPEEIKQKIAEQQNNITKYKDLSKCIVDLQKTVKTYQNIIEGISRPSSKEAAKDQVQNAAPQGKGFVASNQALNQQKSLGQTKIGFGAKEQKANQTRGILSNINAKVGNSMVQNIKPKIIVSQVASQIKSKLTTQTQNLHNTKVASMPSQAKNVIKGGAVNF